MFALALRISEVSHYSNKFKHAIQIQDLKFKRNKIILKLKTFKHSKETSTYEIKDVRLIKNLELWVQKRGSAPGVLYMHKNKKTIH